MITVKITSYNYSLLDAYGKNIVASLNGKYNISFRAKTKAANFEEIELRTERKPEDCFIFWKIT
jgi:hypothetical protein